MSALYWRDPLWLLLGLLPLLWLSWQGWRANRLRQQYADPRLWAWALSQRQGRHNHWRRFTLIVSWLLLGMAAAGPRLPSVSSADHTPIQGSLMIVLDLSRSMDAEDVWPSRRQLALRTLRDLLPQLHASQVGLVVVAGRAHLLWPVSRDRAGLLALIEQLNPLRLPSHGSALAAGVELAKDSVRDSAFPQTLLLLTDGDLTASAYPALRTALSTQPAIKTLIVGVGTPGGAALAGPDGDWLRQHGEPVLSHLAEAQLSQMAQASNSDYLTLSETQPSQQVLRALPERLSRLSLGSDAPLLWQELFPWLLLPSVLLGLIGVLHLPEKAAPTGLLATVLYLMGLSMALPAKAGLLDQAYAALRSDDPVRARMLYDQIAGFAARMGSGAACHQLQDWACARQAFSQSVLLATNDNQRANAIYNLAHSQFQTGDYAGAANLFEDALRYLPTLSAARHNRDYARDLAKEVERLRGGPQAEGRRRGSANSTSSDAAPDTAPRTLTASNQTALTDPASTTAAHQALINRGLDFTRLSLAATADAQRPWGLGFGQMSRETLPDITLWQALLERAEGLPASPEEPLTLPGIRPW